MVDSLHDLPAGLQQLAGQAFAPGEPPTTIFVIPPQSLPRNLDGRGGWKRINERALLFTPRGMVYVQADASPNIPGQIETIRGDQLLYARLSLILLSTRLELCTVEGDTLKHIVIDYNAVGHHLLQPALNCFLQMSWGTTPRRPTPAQDQTKALLEALCQQSLKFKNGLRIYAMQPGEHLLGFVFQPRLVDRIMHIFPRTAAPATVLALTENEHLIVEEARNQPNSYGWVITYCPRKNIERIETIPGAERVDLQIHMKMGGVSAVRQVMVEQDTAQAWQALWAQHA